MLVSEIPGRGIVLFCFNLRVLLFLRGSALNQNRVPLARAPKLEALPAALNDIEFSDQLATETAISLSFHPSPPILQPDLSRRIALPPFDSIIILSVAISPWRRRILFRAGQRGTSSVRTVINAAPSNPVTGAASPAMVTCLHPSTLAFCLFPALRTLST